MLTEFVCIRKFYITRDPILLIYCIKWIRIVIVSVNIDLSLQNKFSLMPKE